ncbi:adenosine 3'-phospho 5'-phosphosulfate transporter 2 [Pelomyxa schiedti]|nr:adenosine 3'-phospho 5'-phosphosulfate transporter 2 [Pelomyxa schiedti]
MMNEVGDVACAGDEGSASHRVADVVVLGGPGGANVVLSGNPTINTKNNNNARRVGGGSGVGVRVTATTNGDYDGDPEMGPRTTTAATATGKGESAGEGEGEGEGEGGVGATLDSDPEDQNGGSLADKRNTVVLLIGCLMLSYCLFIILQESIFKKHDCDYAGFVTLVHFLMFFTLGLVERWGHNRWPLSLLNLSLVNDYRSRRAPMWYHIRVAFFNVSGFSLSTYSLQLLNFPTWLLFKSARVVVTMIGGIVILNKRYTSREYGSVILIAGGLVIVTLADITVIPKFSFSGIFLVCLALVMNACQDNSQEKGMKEYGVSENELVVYSFGIGALMLLPWLIVSDELFMALAFLSERKFVMVQIIVAGLLAYCGTLCVLMLVKRTSALTAVITTSCRKALSLLLSFLLFSKPFTPLYVVGSLVVFSGVVLNIKSKPHRQPQQLPTTIQSLAESTSETPTGDPSAVVVSIDHNPPPQTHPP